MSDNIVAFIAVYDTKDAAETDYEAVKALHLAGVLGTYDAAIVSKDDSGKVHIHKHEKPTQHGAWSGLAVGALVGVVFPPSLIAGGAVGAVAGGLIGHLKGGVSRSDVKQLGDLLDEGQASFVVIGESKLEEALKREAKHAVKVYEKTITADAKALRRELDSAIDDASSS